PCDNGVVIRAGIEPDLGDPFLRDLLYHADAGIGVDVHRRQIDRTGYVQHRAIGPEALDLGFMRVDGDHGEPLMGVGPQRLVSELRAVRRGADDGDGFHERGSAMEGKKSARKTPMTPKLLDRPFWSDISSLHCVRRILTRSRARR